MLLQRDQVPVVEAVLRVMAVQAQQPASPYLALWNRVRDLDPREVDDALTHHQLVKATLLRLTLHVVHADDYGPLRRAMEPTLRSALYDDSRYTATGLTPEDGDALIPDLCAYADRPRTKADMQAWLEQRHGRPLEPDAWRAFRGYAPLLHTPTPIRA